MVGYEGCLAVEDREWVFGTADGGLAGLVFLFVPLYQLFPLSKTKTVMRQIGNGREYCLEEIFGRVDFLDDEGQHFR